jgi:hypothetical protein
MRGMPVQLAAQLCELRLGRCQVRVHRPENGGLAGVCLRIRQPNLVTRGERSVLTQPQLPHTDVVESFPAVQHALDLLGHEAFVERVCQARKPVPQCPE